MNCCLPSCCDLSSVKASNYVAYCKPESGNCSLNNTNSTCALTLKKLMQLVVVMIIKILNF